MTDDRFYQIGRLIEDAGRCFDPITGLFESTGNEKNIAMGLEPVGFSAC